jgi:hypothetical protein
MMACKTVAVVAGLASAACWLVSAFINIHDVSGNFWSKPLSNPVVEHRRDLSKFFNAAAAILSAIAVVAQVM